MNPFYIGPGDEEDDEDGEDEEIGLGAVTQMTKGGWAGHTWDAAGFWFP